MNFLAHLYLSGNDEGVRIGNFIGDFVKGNAYKDYSKDLRTGIRLHREIDRFTDQHEVVRESKRRLRPKYRHYAPVIVDVFYDHFLASMWENYHPQPLLTFSEAFYRSTEKYREVMPAKASQMLFYMQKDNWLFHYQHLDGIRRTLSGMARRTPFHSKMELAPADLVHDYPAYKAEFVSFWPDLNAHAAGYLKSLI